MDGYRRSPELEAEESARLVGTLEDAVGQRKKTSQYEWFVAGVLCLTPFLYGIHIGELNIPQEVITSCREVGDYQNGNVSRPVFVQLGLLTSTSESSSPSLPKCLPMSDATFSFAVSIFTLGGLIGSLVAGKLADTHGRRSSVYLANVAFLLAAMIESLARDPSELFMGRFFAGLGSGVGVVVVPTYLSEVAQTTHRGLFGTLHQLGVVCGILFIQVLSIFLSYIPGWRILLGISAIPAGLQLVLMRGVVSSPSHLARVGRMFDARASLQRLRGLTAAEAERELTSHRYYDGEDATRRDSEGHDEEVPISGGSLINAENNGAAAPEPVRGNLLGVLDVVKRREYRMSLVVVLLLQLTQQLSGINAVMYYSTAIMSSVLPGRSASITISISIVNVLMTLPSVYLVDRTGRRALFLSSLGSMCAATTILAFGMWQNMDALSSLAIVLFVATFSLGVGPIPFLITSEVFDAKAVSSAASIGLSANWVSNFVVGATFLPLTEALGNSSAGVFLLFALVQLSAFLAALHLMPETKGKSAEQVIRQAWRR